MAVRRIHVSLWPHTATTTVTIVIEDVSGRRRVHGGVAGTTLPIGVADFHGQPKEMVLRALGEALIALAPPHPPEGGPASLEGPQGGLPGQGVLPLDLT